MSRTICVIIFETTVDVFTMPTSSSTISNANKLKYTLWYIESTPDLKELKVKY